MRARQVAQGHPVDRPHHGSAGAGGRCWEKGSQQQRQEKRRRCLNRCWFPPYAFRSATTGQVISLGSLIPMTPSLPASPHHESIFFKDCIAHYSRLSFIKRLFLSLEFDALNRYHM